MVAFKEEFPYLRTDTGQLFEFNRDWLHAAITRAAHEAGYPSWWLTDHVTESIAFYLHLRNDENVVAFNQLSQTVRYVLKAIGYKEIVPHFAPSPPPISISLLDIANHAGAGYELAFFDLLEKRISSLLEIGADNFQLCSLQACVKRLRGVKTWTRACDALRGWEATLSPRLTRGLDTDQTCSVLSVRASCARFGSSLGHLRPHGFPGSPACGSRRVRQCYATEVLSCAAQPLNSGGPA